MTRIRFSPKIAREVMECTLFSLSKRLSTHINTMTEESHSRLSLESSLKEFNFVGKGSCLGVGACNHVLYTH